MELKKLKRDDVVKIRCLAHGKGNLMDLHVLRAYCAVSGDGCQGRDGENRTIRDISIDPTSGLMVAHFAMGGCCPPEAIQCKVNETGAPWEPPEETEDRKELSKDRTAIGSLQATFDFLESVPAKKRSKIAIPDKALDIKPKLTKPARKDCNCADCRRARGEQL